MTTTVTLKTHDWPVQVLEFPLIERQPVEDAEYVELAIVPPHSSRDFHVHSSADLLFKELASDEEQGDDAKTASS